MKYSKEYLLSEISRYIKEHDGNFPQSADIKVKNGYPSLASYINTFGSWNLALEAYEDSLFPEQMIEPDLIGKYTNICENEIYKLYLKYPHISIMEISTIFEMGYNTGVSAEAEAVDLQFMKDMYL